MLLRHASPGLFLRLGGLALVITLGGWLDRPAAVAAEKVPVEILVRDSLTMPGRPVSLEASVLRKGLLTTTGVGGERVEFLVDGRTIGTALSGGDGRALIEHTPRMRGRHEITAVLAPNPRVSGPDGRGTLWCWERRRPVLLVDLGAITQARRPLVPLPGLPLDFGLLDRQAEADAAAELKKLAEFFYNVIYLARTGPDNLQQLREIRSWLEDHHFPGGLTVMLKPGRDDLGATIDALRAEGWDNVKAGIGRTKEFAEVLLARRMGVVILADSDKDVELPRKALPVKSWKEVRKKL